MIAVRVLVIAGALACGGASAQDAKPKTYKVHFDNAKWDDVFAWYAKETGLGFIPPKEKPKGALTLKPGADKKFTVGEMTDLLNESLAQQKWILIRGHQWFRIVSADEKIDPMLVPRVTLDDLKNRGNTELVQTVLKLPVDAGDVSDDELKRLLTPFGSLVRLKTSILVTDTVGNVVRIQKTLESP